MSASSVASEAPSRVVVVASSTGGPAALARVMAALPRPLGAAVLVAQHMPAGFTATLAKRLDSTGPLPAGEAEDGEALEGDRVYVAPGGTHLVVERAANDVRLRLDHGAAVWGVRPAADLLFASAAATFGAGVVGVVLTGMGRDGAAGLRAVRDAGGVALVQDRASSVVYGMPHAALQLAGADRELALGDVAGAIVEALSSLGSPR